ncbi:MAG: hypothetical protein QXE10_01630 [Desulfurococcaceae archaeon]
MRRGEVAKPRLLRVLLTLVETTSLPLLVTCLLYLLTGYQMLIPGLKLIPRAHELHTDLVLRSLTLILGLVHGYSGLIILSERRIRNNTIRTIVEVAVTILLVGLTVLLATLELYISG